ncbi:Gfo/Idh/MocA family oxidoreductase [Halomonas sp.]|uniref:Gfo/Idh/MocA family protein n=1 Tax=Halomonas sp. TaxID=1486246 RepID=UPI00298EB4AC|nr:Gfo/Idh/MocA family oxidoreductase [Halomonas sp.]MDW7745693.1 Gfo/Idh/MocA family oxidoreductase [Halomonas sp.]
MSDEKHYTPVRWGILGAARIAKEHVIPAMHASQYGYPKAIAARDQDRALKTAKDFDIPFVYDSYDALLSDSNIDAVYIPLPNHLHVEYALKAAEKGKHVLCEKPIALTAAQAEKLQDAALHVHIAEAFMPRHQPRWHYARDLAMRGALGEVRILQACLTFYMNNPTDFRRHPEYGGGALYDVGCYAVMASRYFFAAEPQRVMALMQGDGTEGVDNLTSVILDFGCGRHALFSVSTVLAAAQHLHLIGSQGSVDLPLPFIAPNDRPTTLAFDDASDLYACHPREIIFETIDQYLCEIDHFSRVVRGEEVPGFGIADAVANMRVVDALFVSARSGTWQACQPQSAG